MSQDVYQIKLNPQSESFYFIPRPKYHDALCYLTSMAHEYPTLDYYIERSKTECYMVSYILGGKGRFIYNGVPLELEKGTLIFAYLGIHNALFPLSEDFEFCCFHLHSPHVKALWQHATGNGTRITFAYPEKDILPLFEELKPLIAPSPKYFAISKLLHGFLTDILEFCVGTIEKVSPLVHEVNKLIVSHNMSVGEIAKRLNFSASHLEREFKKHTGKSIRDFLVARRLEQAENLLLTTKLSIKEIAERVGYADTVGLIHLFRKHRNCTPLAFRKTRGRI